MFSLRCRSLSALALCLALVVAIPIGRSSAAESVPLPEHVTFVHGGALEQTLAGDDAATVLVDPALLPAGEPGFEGPLEVVAHWWAPDGTHVLVGVSSTVTGARRLFICDHNGTDPVPVEVASGLFLERGDGGYQLWDNPVPAWSPDGQSLALTVFDGDAAFGDIYVVSLEGVGELVGSGIEPAWSPDATQIAYTRAVAGATSVDDSRPYVVVGSLGGADSELGIGRAPLFSPDGTEVLYRTWSESAGEGGSSEQLVVTPVDGGATRQLTAYGPMDDMGGPAAILDYRYSPDGTRAYYLFGRRSDGRGVWEVAADGSSAPVDASGLASEFVLSIDGTQLVYTRGEVYEASYQTRQQIYARDLASSAEWQLTGDELAGFACSNLSVSHQDRYVAFDAAVIPAGSLPGSATSREVWVATLDGSHAWRCAVDAWDVASQPMYSPSVAGDGGPPSEDDLDSMDDDYDPTRKGFFEMIGDAIAAFFDWLAGLFS
ncbi:MAG: PD40 domain-containing protein [Coriobacteriia bacterium]|nr:PD40 domain-containing protein [Coriobacteriia bacterium]